MERHYVPQVGDKVYFFFQGYEEFLREFWEVIEFKNQNEILPFVQWRKLMEPCLCEVTTVEFEFPVIRNKKVLRKWENNISLLMKLGMKEIELGFEFQVCINFISKFI